MSREDLWLHDNLGYPIFNKNKPILDFIKPEAREMWKKGTYRLFVTGLYKQYNPRFQYRCQFFKPQEAGPMECS